MFTPQAADLNTAKHIICNIMKRLVSHNAPDDTWIEVQKLSEECSKALIGVFGYEAIADSKTLHNRIIMLLRTNNPTIMSHRPRFGSESRHLRVHLDFSRTGGEFLDTFVATCIFMQKRKKGFKEREEAAAAAQAVAAQVSSPAGSVDVEMLRRQVSALRTERDEALNLIKELASSYDDFETRLGSLLVNTISQAVIKEVSVAVAHELATMRNERAAKLSSKAA